MLATDGDGCLKFDSKNETPKHGEEPGQVCNRRGCLGILVDTTEIDKVIYEQGCSCHINPPCSFCVMNHTACPVCGWQGKDDE
jgi:hypothetical protein